MDNERTLENFYKELADLMLKHGVFSIDVYGCADGCSDTEIEFHFKNYEESYLWGNRITVENIEDRFSLCE